MINQFSNISCYEEFEIQSALNGISKVDVLKEIGHKVNDYYFFVSEDGIFNWFDLNGNHIEDPGVLKTLIERHIPKTITKCIIPNSVIRIADATFSNYKSLKEVIIPNSVIYIYSCAFANCDSLKEIIITDSVMGISDYAFFGCNSLTTITISNNITYIGDNVFRRCKSLKEVIFKGKTLDQIKQMKNYPFGIEDESIIKVSEIQTC